MFKVFRFLKLFVFSLICVSCNFSTNPHIHKYHIQAFYENSFIDSELNCDFDFKAIEKNQYGELLDLGQIVLTDSIYSDIKKHVAALRKNYDPLRDSIDYSIPLHFQANFYENDSLIYRVCIDYFNRISINGDVVNSNDTLVYLLRKNTRLYNYYPAEELEFFRELNKFGLPSDYVNLSKDSSVRSALYNKVILKGK